MMIDSGILLGGFSVGLAVWLFSLGSQAIWKSFKHVVNG